jgi:hypothetical protein
MPPAQARVKQVFFLFGGRSDRTSFKRVFETSGNAATFHYHPAKSFGGDG